jgi:hypothetical protein
MNVSGRWSLALVLGLWAAGLRAEEIQWRPARPSSTPAAAAANVEPVFRLGRPVPVGAATAPLPRDEQVHQTAWSSAAVPDTAPSLQPIFRAQSPGVEPVPPPPPPGVGPPPPPPPPGAEDYNCGVPTTPPVGLLQQITQPCGPRSLFQSDHCFDSFVSPVTNPFFFLDARALTEVRPIILWQQTPRSNSLYAGSDIIFVGLQGSVALTERLSVYVSKLGWIWNEVHNGTTDLSSHDGFVGVNLGGQYAIIRNEKCEGILPGKTLLTVGMQFEIPAGPNKVAQDTGNLSLTPYLSFAQEFGETPYGTFHFMKTTGFSLSIDQVRTDFFFSSYHLDFGIGKCPQWYPFVELNWFYYFHSGTARNFTFEGRDLFNFGSTQIGGHHDLAIAVGTRYKITEWAQLGGAIEFPLLNNHQLMNFRVTFDAIFKY